MAVSRLPAKVGVLVFDDIPSRRAVVIDLLHTIGAHSVQQAAGLSEAFRELDTSPVDVILLACRDSGEALEFVGQIRASDTHAYIPILLIVDGVDGPTASSSRDTGVTDFIARPVTESGLCNALTNVLPLDKHHRPTVAPGSPIFLGRLS